MKQKIGILGGSFNPIHKAHISLANYFLSESKAQKVIFVPCYVSPFKLSNKKDNSELRLEMVKIATENTSNLEVSAYEIEKKGISYTYETIEHFSQQFPNDELCLLLGGDQAENFHKWKNWQQILDKADIYVALRKGYKVPTYEFESYKKAVYLEMPFVNISSSEIRKQLADGKRSIEFLDPKVEEYIIANKVY